LRKELIILETFWKNEKWWVSSYNYAEEVIRDIHFPQSIKLHDATLRDGEQTPGVILRKGEKIEIARKLDEAGVHRIEAGMPAVSEEDRQAIEEIKKLKLKSEIFSFARAKNEDIYISKECGVDGIIVEVPVGRPKLELQFHWDIDRVIEASVTSVQYAKSLGLYTVFFPYDTTRADEADLEKLLQAVTTQAKPDSVGLVDTMGCAHPRTMAYLTKLMKKYSGGLPVEVHTHNDFGMAVASSIEALIAGAEVVHGCFNGIGERTGNVALEEVVASLKLLYGVDLGIDFDKMVEVCAIIEKLTGINLQRNKPITGKNNYMRESGIGVDMIFNEPLAMFATHPSLFGREAKLALGKKSGATSIDVKLKELNLEIDEESCALLVQDVKLLGTNKKALVSDAEFLELLKKYQ
jgi:isopropylmalate/homocitrate/citramalate synthase